jgi:NAD+ synthase (glutamine-hydrolysing)
MKKLRICNSQINCNIGDLHGNAEKIIRNIELARESEADIVTFPELAVCGYPPEDLLLKPSFILENLKTLNEITKSTKGITAVVGFVEQHDGLYNAAAVISDCELKGIYRKMFLPNYSVFDESRYFSKGDTGNLTFKLNDVIFAVNICEDIWYTSGPLMKQALGAGAELVINISASPFYAGKINAREGMLKARATDNLVMISYTNMVGGQDELVFDGGSMIIDCEGEVISSAKRFKEDIIFADLDIENVVRKRLYSPHHKFERDTPTLEKSGFQTINIGGRAGAKKSARITTAIQERTGEIEEVYDALCLGIKDYVRKNGFKKVVVGLSGGIDSALTAALAVQALGAESVAGVTMPSCYSSAETKSDAEKLAASLGIKFITLPIDDIYEEYLAGLKDVFKDSVMDATEENVQARIRGNLLMALSNKFGWLVLSTGNKSEVSVGYCTLYGDMVGGFSVLKDVYKTVVYKLSEFINSKEGREVIPKSTILREPTAELSPDQKDSDILPPYDVLDGILNHYVEMDLCVEEIIDCGFDEDVVKNIVRMVDANEYKRRQAPPGVKITQKAFGKDRRMPITKSYRMTKRDAPE